MSALAAAIVLAGCACLAAGRVDLQPQPAAVIAPLAPLNAPALNVPAPAVAVSTVSQAVGAAAARGAAPVVNGTARTPGPLLPVTPGPQPAAGAGANAAAVAPRPPGTAVLPAASVAAERGQAPAGTQTPTPAQLGALPATQQQLNPGPAPGAAVPLPTGGNRTVNQPPQATSVLSNARTPAANPAAAAAAPPRPAPAAAAATAAASAPPAVPTAPAARVTPPKVPAAPRLPSTVLERALSNSSRGTSARQANSSGVVEVTLLHFNDWHVRVESSKGRWCGLCTPYDVNKGRCSGGLARMATFVKQQRQLDPGLLLLNAGDDFIGTEWDRKAGLEAPAAFMNLLATDIMTLGNHEWDKGLPALSRYLDALGDQDILSANIDWQGHALRNRVKPYVVKLVKGKKICIFGLTTRYSLPASSQMGPVKITEPYSVGRQVVKDLQKEGCHATVLLSHLGYTSDLVAASSIPGLDLVIGGHSHTFLWPDPEAPPAFYNPAAEGGSSCCGSQYDSTWGPYPTYVHTKGLDGKPRDVPVVQASWGGRYMGRVVLRFKPGEPGGRVSGVQSEVFLLGGPGSDVHVAEDPQALQEIKRWRTW